MSQEPEVKAAIISSKSGIWIAIIGLLGGLLIAILPPYATKWANQPEPTPNPTSLIIEQIPFWISTYDGEGDSDPNCCAGHADFEYGNGVSPFPEYLLSYSMSDDKSRYSYAGIDFVFKPSQNFSDFRNIEFTIYFGKTVNQADFKFEDIAGVIEPFRLVGNADSNKRFVVSLSNFNQIDFNAMRVISFQVDSTFANGKDSLTVKNIVLTK